MTITLTPVNAVIRHCWVEVDATHETDEFGGYTLITITVSETGEPLFDDDIVADGHISQGDLLRVVDDLVSGHSQPTRADWSWAA